MITFDLETTKLKECRLADIGKQPKIIEFAAIKLDGKLQEVGRFSTFINPKEPLDPVITRITRITDEMLKDAPTFAEVKDEIADFFLGEKTMIAHNLMFDADVLKYELRRMEQEYKFPWPTNWVCTVEESMNINGHRMKQGDLYKHYFGKEFEGAHRAINDVEALTEIVLAMIGEGRLIVD